jgi:hypothetical protein
MISRALATIKKKDRKPEVDLKVPGNTVRSVHPSVLSEAIADQDG